MLEQDIEMGENHGEIEVTIFAYYSVTKIQLVFRNLKTAN